MTIYSRELEYKDESEDFLLWSYDKFKRYFVSQLVEGFVMGGSKEVGTRVHWMLVEFMQWKSNHDQRLKELEASKRKGKTDKARKEDGAAQ